MLSDFDLAKQSAEFASMPSMVHSEHNGVGGFKFVKSKQDQMLISPRSYLRVQVPLVDTMSCTANFRTNSFVGTEGKAITS